MLSIDLSIQGNIKGVRTLVEPCQVAMENGARRVMLPIGTKLRFSSRAPFFFVTAGM